MTDARADRLDALLSAPRLFTAGVSLDGAWAVWTWMGTAPGADVYAGRTDRPDVPIRLTDTVENTRFVSLTPDSRSVLVAQDRGGDERDQLFRVDLDQPGLMHPLTQSSPPYFLRGGQLHPNGRWLVYGMNFDVETGREIEATWVYRHDLDSGERAPLACPSRTGYSAPQMNDAGTHIHYQRQEIDPAGTQIWLVDIEGREDREIINLGPSVKVYPSWFPDGRRVLFLAEADGYRRMGMWELATGEIAWLLDDPARNLEWAFVPHGPERPTAILIDVEKARTRASFLDIETGEETSLPAGAGSLIPHHSLADSRWVGRYASAQHPDDLVTFRPSDVDPHALTSITGMWERTSLRPGDLTAAEDFRWRSEDKLDIQGWLYRPSGPSRGTILRIHGGPTSHSEDEFSAATQYFVSRGFTVLEPNYRGSTGFGLPFQEAIKVDGWGGREQDDIRAGIIALIDAGIAEPGKVGVTGTSYGGYSSWCAITRWQPDLVAAAAPICGMTDLVVDYETTRPDLRLYSEEMLGGTPQEVPERYYERSPIHFVDRIKGRLLIVQGLRDPNVTPENVSAVQGALDAAGIDYQTLTFADEGHGISRPANQRVLYRRLAEFFGEAFSASLEETCGAGSI